MDSRAWPKAQRSPGPHGPGPVVAMPYSPSVVTTMALRMAFRHWLMDVDTDMYLQSESSGLAPDDRFPSAVLARSLKVLRECVNDATRIYIWNAVHSLHAVVADVMFYRHRIGCTLLGLEAGPLVRHLESAQVLLCSDIGSHFGSHFFGPLWFFGEQFWRPN